MSGGVTATNTLDGDRRCNTGKEIKHQETVTLGNSRLFFLTDQAKLNHQVNEKLYLCL